MTMRDDNGWTLHRLSLRNFRNFPALDINFSPKITLLVGRNGSGKTSVLDALAIMLRVPLRNLSGKRDNELSAEPLQFVDGDAHLKVTSLEPKDCSH